MKELTLRLFVLSGCLTPAATLAHPGHADGAPLLHALTHGLFYLAAAISVGLLATRAIRRTLLSKSEQTAHRDMRS